MHLKLLPVAVVPVLRFVQYKIYAPFHSEARSDFNTMLLFPSTFTLSLLQSIYPGTTARLVCLPSNKPNA